MDVLMPQLGETVKEGTISAWYKQPGEAVRAGEALFEIETDKTSMEVQAVAGGLLADVRVKVGETVPVGALIAVIRKAGDEAIALPAKSDAPQQVANATNGRSEPLNGHPSPVASGPSIWFGPFSEVRTPERNFGRARGPEGLRVTPLARRLIAQNGADLESIARQVQAAGGSRIAARDVEAALSARGRDIAGSEPALEARSRDASERTSLELNRVRQQTGRHLAESWRTAPHVLQAIEIDFSAVAKVRDARKADFKERHGAALSFLPFIARATCLAIAAFPQVNARLEETRLVISHEVHLGIAVDLSHDGLVVPVLRHAQGLAVAGIATAMQRLIEDARTGRLKPSDLDGGTYTISNNGSFGTLFTAPIINLPQVAILSTDAIRKRPVVVETEFGDAIVARPVGVVAQSFDHRAFDGAYSAAFLSKLKDIIEHRDWAAEFS